MKIAFFSAKCYEKRIFDFHNKDQHQIEYFPETLSESNVNLAEGFDVICLFTNDLVNDAVIKALNRFSVKLIALRASGYDNIQYSNSSSYNIRVVNVPQYSACAVAEFTVGLMMSINRKIHKAHIQTINRNFSLENLMGFDMCEKTIGIIGLGSIGRSIAKILRGFGSRVLVYDVKVDHDFVKVHQLQSVELETLLRESDIITLHTLLNEKTKHIVNADTIAKMKDGVILVNTARGGLIDTNALISSLQSGKVGAAALDVCENEQKYYHKDYSHKVVGDDNISRLLMFPNVLMTAHQASLTEEAFTNMAKTTFENIKEFEQGQKLTNEVKGF